MDYNNSYKQFTAGYKYDLNKSGSKKKRKKGVQILRKRKYLECEVHNRLNISNYHYLSQICDNLYQILTNRRNVKM